GLETDGTLEVLIGFAVAAQQAPRQCPAVQRRGVIGVDREPRGRLRLRAFGAHLGRAEALNVRAPRRWSLRKRQRGKQQRPRYEMNRLNAAYTGSRTRCDLKDNAMTLHTHLHSEGSMSANVALGKL